MDRIRVNEGSTKVVEFDILDEAGDGVPAADLDTATLRLYDLDTYVPGGSPAQGILNDRDEEDVLDTNDVDIDADGHVTWTMQPEDNQIVTPRRQIERHRALFAFTWDTGAYQQEIEIEVVNLRGAA